MKNWLKELSTNILANILTPVVVFLVIASAGLIFAGYLSLRENLQTGILVLLTVLTLLNTFLIVYLVREHRAERIISEMQRQLDQGDLKKLSLEHWQILQSLKATQDEAAQPGSKLSAEDSHRFEIQDILPINNKVFDENSDPQKIHLEFVNLDARDNIFHVRTIKYRGTGGDLGEQHLSARYRRDGRYLIVPCEQKDIAPGQTLVIDLERRNKWRAADINRLAGKWGWLTFEVTFKGESLELPPYSL